MIQTLKNNLLTVTASTHGAELQNITANFNGHEYLWHGDPAFWGRRSPVLFPQVGQSWDGVFRIDGHEYHMGQHGFARDMDFEVLDTDIEDEIWFRLDATDEALLRYPRRFRLDIGYRLQGERLTVLWRVENHDTRSMDFQIGAHPAFMLPEFSAADPVHGYFAFDARDLRSQVIAEKGCVGTAEKAVPLADGFLPIEASTFADDALIFGGNRVHRVSLLTKEKAPYLSLFFRSPYVGLWAPKPDAPFVCIAPGYGRADSVGYTGDFHGKTAVNTLQPGETFNAEYTIIFENI